ncbi:Glyoxalase/Bleomycin resistance protein/Dioxygenase superfamily protein [uncultured archaeon]|nr:Glyoxalase/Bleomycin resistance protein/Dioxygenase superfamily protein [uncultured archaeon]
MTLVVWGKTPMKIKLSSVFVDDQDKALKFYTEVLGFVKKRDIPVGKFKWLTVVSPEEPYGTELVLEPDDNPAAKTFKKALFEQGIPLTAFDVDDIQKEYERMNKLGVVFRGEPTKMGPITQAVFDDTCGNLIQIYKTEHMSRGLIARASIIINAPIAKV